MASNVLLLPGFGCDGDSMLELHAALEDSDREYTATVMDFAGDTSLSGMIEHVETSIGADTTTLIGFSMGGWVSQAVAARAPERVASLVLISSWTHGK